ncbi:MAG TPA: DUF2459 domain-containing protein [Crenalkalicoccus sp.]|nr:DUF2459 domain-containing protein [Crenalkalicoccus sp.]
MAGPGGAATWLLFGFGERGYWTSPDRTWLDAALALIPGRGAILVTGLRAPPAAAFAEVTDFRISASGLERLRGFLARSLGRDAAGAPQRIADGPYPGSLFFAATPTYSLAYTCNTWTAEGLQVAGTGVPAAGALLSGQLMQRARAAASAGGDDHGLRRRVGVAAAEGHAPAEGGGEEQDGGEAHGMAP